MIKLMAGAYAFFYLPIISLFIMPLVYGKTYIGIIAWIPLWTVNVFGSIILHFINESWRDSFHNTLNMSANWVMTLNWRTVSNEIGIRIDDGKASTIEKIHCRLLGTFDPVSWHCTPKAKSLV